jgi:anti-sigma B factor antagonist
VRVIERTTLIRFEDAEFLLDDGDGQVMGEQLKSLIKDEGHSRLVVNLGGVKYMSGALLGKLARLANRVQQMGGQIQVCGLDPLLRDVLRHTHLDKVLDVCGDEAEALGLIIP